jgi:hypothetical protein
MCAVNLSISFTYSSFIGLVPLPLKISKAHLQQAVADHILHL